MGTAFTTIAGGEASPLLLVCDHAENFVPDTIDLGIDTEELTRHIAYDIGVRGLTEALSSKLDAPAVLSRFSRLVIDPNRGEDDPTLITQLYDGTIIEGNRRPDREWRLENLYRPYHNEISRVAETMAGPILISIHSFTPQLRGRPPRPWHISILSADDRRIADPLLTRLREERDLTIGDNVPYRGSLRGDCMDRHGLQKGRAHALIEIRNDLIETPETQENWAHRLAPILQEVTQNPLRM